jgi:uncharacterized protein (DUF302 family)
MDEIDIISKFSFDQTVSNLREAIKNRKLTEFAVFDHRLNAEKVGLNMNNCTVFVFGNPTVGTYLMQEIPAIGLDLPSRILVYEVNANTHIRFRSFQDIFEGEKSKEAVRKLNSATEAIARESAGINP